MKWSCRKRVYYWFLDYGEIAFVLSILVMSVILIIWMLILLLVPKTAMAGDITNFRTATRQAPATLRSDTPSSRDFVPIAEVWCTCTAYSPSVQECDAAPLITASGKHVYVGGVAACLSQFPFGTILLIPNYNNGDPCTVIDTGSAIVKNCLDVFMWSETDAIRWGRRKNVCVTVLYMPKAK